MDGISISIEIAAFIIGAAVSYFVWNKALAKKAQNVIDDATADAEVVRKDKILQAKEKFLQLKSEHEKHINERNSKMQSAESKIKNREQNLNQTQTF